ncbi:MAG: AAA-like domain-containing protein [Phycisphaerales bacterium]|nr:MAG: AAA-like domain-containing protein [Phycisphaerales bacterium]
MSRHPVATVLSAGIKAALAAMETSPAVTGISVFLAELLPHLDKRPDPEKDALRSATLDDLGRALRGLDELTVRATLERAAITRIEELVAPLHGKLQTQLTRIDATTTKTLHTVSRMEARLNDMARQSGGLHDSTEAEIKSPEEGGVPQPGGALPVESPYYVTRDADRRVLASVGRERGLGAIRAPRQSGKTSLILRICADLGRGGDFTIAFLDCQLLDLQELASVNDLWCALAQMISDQLDLAPLDETSWNSNRGYQYNVNRLMQDRVLAEREKLLLCLDEVDRILYSNLSNAFFGAVRAFYNDGALSSSPWRKVSWLLSSASEPAFFISDPMQSPFNLTEPVNLEFGEENVSALAKLLGFELDESQRHRLYGYVGSRPYLTHLLLFELAQGTPAERLFDGAGAGGGVFRRHLLRFEQQFSTEPKLAAAMRDVVAERGCRDVAFARRLEAAGLAIRDHQGKVVPSCGLYTDYFAKHL